MSAKRIIDTHLHLWDPDRFRYPWLESYPPLLRSFGPAEYLLEWGTKPDGAVFVQCECERHEASNEVLWVAELARMYPWIRGIVAFAPLDAEEPECKRALDQLAAVELVKGIRFIIEGQPGELLRTARFRRNLKAVFERHLRFELCLRPSSMDVAIDLIDQYPDGVFVLDHLGKPAVASRTFDSWESGIRRMAVYPNVVGKVSGLVNEAADRNWTIRDMAPFLRVALDAFGPGRLLFGSDWPFSTLKSRVTHWRDTVQLFFEDLSAEDQAALWYDNAARIYQLEP